MENLELASSENASIKEEIGRFTDEQIQRFQLQDLVGELHAAISQDGGNGACLQAFLASLPGVDVNSNVDFNSIFSDHDKDDSACCTENDPLGRACHAPASTPSPESIISSLADSPASSTDRDLLSLLPPSPSALSVESILGLNASFEDIQEYTELTSLADILQVSSSSACAQDDSLKDSSGTLPPGNCDPPFISKLTTQEPQLMDTLQSCEPILASQWQDNTLYPSSEIPPDLDISACTFSFNSTLASDTIQSCTFSATPTDITTTSAFSPTIAPASVECIDNGITTQCNNNITLCNTSTLTNYAGTSGACCHEASSAGAESASQLQGLSFWLLMLLTAMRLRVSAPRDASVQHPGAFLTLLMALMTTLGLKSSSSSRTLSSQHQRAPSARFSPTLCRRVLVPPWKCLPNGSGCLPKSAMPCC